jgi:hypothetical protein
VNHPVPPEPSDAGAEKGVELVPPVSLTISEKLIIRGNKHQIGTEYMFLMQCLKEFSDRVLY